MKFHPEVTGSVINSLLRILRGLFEWEHVSLWRIAQPIIITSRKADNMELPKALLRVLRLSPISIIPPLLHAHNSSSMDAT
jgi:hypothetical protein